MKTPLPLAALRRNVVAYRPLAPESTRDWCVEYRAVLDESATVAGELHTLAYRAVADVDADTARVLVDLQRRLRDGRRLPDLPEALRADIRLADAATRHAKLRRRLAELEQELHDTAEDRIADERATLATLLMRPEFAETAALSSPDQYRGVTGYAATGGRDRSKSARRAEHRLLDLAYRAMLRTTPFGRLTAVSVHPDDAASGSSLWELAGAAPTGIIRVLHPSFSQQYSIQGGERPGSRWQLNHSVSRAPDSGVVRFAAVGPDGLVRQIRLPETAFVRALLAVADTGPMPIDELTARLAEQLPGPSAQALTGAVDNCVTNGLLVPAPDTFRPVTSLDLDDEFGRDLADAAAATGDERVRRILEVRTALETRATVVGRPIQPTVYEDSLAAPTPTDLRAARDSIDGLDASLRLRSVYDRNVDLRLISTAAYCELFGADQQLPLLTVARTLVEKTYTRYQLALRDDIAERDLGRLVHSPAYPTLRALRHEIDAAVGERVRAAANAPEVRYSPTDAAALLAAAPAELDELFELSYAVYLQRFPGGVVVNDGYAGNGSMLARFLHDRIPEHAGALDLFRDRIRAWPRPIQQVTDLHGMSVNHCPALTPETATAQRWSRLRLRVRPDGLGLEILDEDDRLVAPMSFGTGMPERFPYHVRLVSWQQLGGRLIRTPMTARHRAVGADPDRVSAVPRLRVGDVVLDRRRWYGLTPLFAGLLSERRPAHALAGLRRRCAEFGLPEQFFVKRDLWRIDPQRPHPKPVFVDAASLLSVSTLGKRLGDERDFTHIEEALPAGYPGRAAAEIVLHEDVRRVR
ncbi:lantibiotic dehydratase [Nocardia pseudobrasiliensis]|uniref:Lantibiotic biosynthesis dehydratase-like protein n=1 Tax=Nocardia pseudobrasiliensis TaxID=45979 RepID=A0A370I9H6_9NOCA|nr:lantibiotic dehydratase [Nocardia pseudobrasiliensis]RDI67369.1 lantibiotic biosynthesis dehydratase-like protein [Nocardia pseudobrasiliensis]